MAIVDFRTVEPLLSEISTSDLCAFDHKAEERRALFQDKWDKSGVHFWTGDAYALKSTPSLGAKRPALFRNLYQVCDQDNVSIVDMNKTPVTKILPNGIVTVDGAIQEIDAIILVTGFDAITGDLKAINIINSAGETLSEKWSNGTWTNLGLKSHDS
ncbi:hypothetical protein H9Q73_013178 [Fusarium xylarioides]|nr:hypothetical protein H9Q73_013178 [Fusarium xylarioides]